MLDRAVAAVAPGWRQSSFHVRTIRYNPFGITIGPNEIQDGFVTRRPIEAGPRVFDQNVDTWHIAAMLDGELNFGDRNWYWDIHTTFAQNQANQRKQGAFSARNLLVAVGDPTVVCAATPGCVVIQLVRRTRTEW